MQVMTSMCFPFYSLVWFMLTVLYSEYKKDPQSQMHSYEPTPTTNPKLSIAIKSSPGDMLITYACIKTLYLECH
jgi:hypothetical protein